MDILANYVGCLHSEIECSHIINLAIQNNLNRLTRRLNENEKRLIRPGYAFVYLEKESGIMRWTDSRSWSPSRALGPFMMYIEKKPENPLIKKIYSARYQEFNVHLVIYNLLNHEETGICCGIYRNVKNNLLPHSLTVMSRCYLKRRHKKQCDSDRFESGNIYNEMISMNRTEDKYQRYPIGNQTTSFLDGNMDTNMFKYLDEDDDSQEN